MGTHGATILQLEILGRTNRRTARLIKALSRAARGARLRALPEKARSRHRRTVAHRADRFGTLLEAVAKVSPINPTKSIDEAQFGDGGDASTDNRRSCARARDTAISVPGVTSVTRQE